MASEQQFINAVNEFNAGEKKRTFAELMAKVWAGKIIEIYIGDTYEDIKFEDSTQKYPAVLIGKVITAYAECLILDCAYVEPGSKDIKFGNIVCLNERSVRTITEVDEKGILKDTFLNSRDSKIVKAVHKALYKGGNV